MMEAYFLGYGLIVIRIAFFFSMIPILSESSNFPYAAKFTLYVMLALFMVHPDAVSAMNYTLTPTYMMLLVKEALVGALMGFVVGLPFRLPQMIGELVDEQRGTITSSQLMTALGEEGSALGQLLMFTFLGYFLLNDGLIYLAAALNKSFAIYPSGSFELNYTEHFYPLVTSFFSDMMRLLVILAAPIIVCLLMVDVGLGMASRIAPAFHAQDLAMTGKAMMGILMILLTQPRMMEYLTNGVYSAVEKLYGG